jgi:hypothetical protein
VDEAAIAAVPDPNTKPLVFSVIEKVVYCPVPPVRDACTMHDGMLVRALAKATVNAVPAEVVPVPVTSVIVPPMLSHTP